ncbi:MAG: DUF1080 domain-containing protein [Planctomycetaceae bacterium]
MTTRFVVLLAACAVCSSSLRADDAQAQAVSGPGWTSLFNGKNLDGWHVKITGYDLNDNHANTFHVKDGLLKVGYSGYDKFDNKFGHIFHKDKYSHYDLRVEYRFVGEQCTGGPGWALRNSGIMLHCQSPQSMTKAQKFPVSIEAQMLGGNGQTKRSTGNLCTPGTNVVMQDKLIKRHCTGSKSKTFHGDQWVTLEVQVRGGKTIKHIVNGETVLAYAQPQLDERDADARKLITDGQKLLTEGYISLQAESHPIEFRKIEIRTLTK